MVRPVAEGRQERSPGSAPLLSVVVPVFEEAENIPSLHERLAAALREMGRSYEIVYVDDGSHDDSLRLLLSVAESDPRVSVVELTRNFGQHAAILAGFAQTRGEIVVTLDADLQNPPEDIGKLVAAIDEGNDVAGGVRVDRRDSFARTIPSLVINRIISGSTGTQLRDYGCMLRAYRREIVEDICRYGEKATFIPALANLFAHRVKEIPVGHAERAAGRSKYNVRKLFHLAFDLMTAFSLLPIRLVTILGGLIAALGMGFGVFLLVRRLIMGPEAEGLFTLFAILFVFVGLQILALGLIGQYIGRIYLEVRRRPPYIVRQIHRHGS